MARLFPLFLIFCLLCGCGSGSGNKPTHTDYLSSIAPARWPAGEVLYRVHGGPPNPLGSEVRKAVGRGVERWAGAVQDSIRLREAEGQEIENISIRFVRVGSLGGDFFGSQTLGRTTFTMVSGSVLSSATVEFDSQLWARLPTLERIAAHEMGHALGLRGHSPFSTDLMAANPARSTLSAADVATIRAVYGAR